MTTSRKTPFTLRALCSLASLCPGSHTTIGEKVGGIACNLLHTLSSSCGGSLGLSISVSLLRLCGALYTITTNLRAFITLYHETRQGTPPEGAHRGVTRSAQ